MKNGINGTGYYINEQDEYSHLWRNDLYEFHYYYNHKGKRPCSGINIIFSGTKKRRPLPPFSLTKPKLNL